MSADTFKTGDVVELKSGSSKMTVGKVFGEVAICLWFNGSGIAEKYFPTATLKLSESQA